MSERGGDVHVLESAGAHRRLAAGAISAYDPGYDADGRIARTALDVALALTSCRFHGRPS